MNNKQIKLWNTVFQYEAIIDKINKLSGFIENVNNEVLAQTNDLVETIIVHTAIQHKVYVGFTAGNGTYFITIKDKHRKVYYSDDITTFPNKIYEAFSSVEILLNQVSDIASICSLASASDFSYDGRTK